MAIREMAEDLMNQFTETDIEIDLSDDSARYSSDLETHVFRIIQEASQNAIRHGNASKIIIEGGLQPDHLHLVIRDNGKGFDAGAGLDLTGLLANRHLGLANMYERATLVGAKVRVESAIGQGTCVIFSWRAGSQQH